MTKIRPLHDNVILKVENPETTSKGGIIIPENVAEKPLMAEVLAVGGGKVLESGQTVPMNVKPGDRVLFGKFAGQEVKLDGETYLMMREEAILGVVERQ